jgi:ornithine carbamoyltransferase
MTMKHFLSLYDLTATEIDRIFDVTAELRDRWREGEAFQPLAGKSVALIFEKSSTRTRVSFEVGCHQLGAQALFLSGRDMQMGRGEPIRDTARVLSRYVQGVMIRTFGQAVLEEFAQYAGVPVINGLTDLLHPCQVLADLQTVIDHQGGYEDLTIAYIGDGNNMANSWLNAVAKLPFRLRLACPPGYHPNQAIFERACRAAPDRVFFTENPAEAARDADVVTTDVWTSMGMEGQEEKRRQAFAGFQVNAELMARADEDAIFLHCLPAHRGEEVTDEVIESPASKVFDEAENRLHVQKAIMVLLMNPEAAE